MKKVPMPEEGEWLIADDEIIHRCCECESVHKWEFAVASDATHIVPLNDFLHGQLDFVLKITRIDKPKRRKK